MNLFKLLGHTNTSQMMREMNTMNSGRQGPLLGAFEPLKARVY